MNKISKLLLGIILISQGLLITRTAAGPFDVQSHFRGVRGTDETKVKEVLKVMQDILNAYDSLQRLGVDVKDPRQKLIQRRMAYTWVIKDPEEFKKITELYLLELPNILGKLRKEIVDREIADIDEEELELYNDYAKTIENYFKEEINPGRIAG